MSKPIHTMIRVMDEAKSVDFYSRAFGMRVADRYDFDGFTLVYLVSEESPFELELTVNHGRTEPYAMGDAYGHIAYAVDNLESEHARFQKENLSPLPIKEFHRDGALMAKFFFVQDPDGYRIEILQRHGRYR